MTITFEPQPDPLARLPALAQRLGIEPLTDEQRKASGVTISTRDGQSYDLFALLNALLDKIEQMHAEIELVSK
jgi:hypothetical protein